MSQKQNSGAAAMLIRLAYRNIWRNKRRTAFCLIAVAFAVFFVAIYSALIDGMINSIGKTVQTFTHGHVRIVSALFEDESERMPVQYPVADGRDWREIAAELAQIPGVKKVIPRIRTMATLQESTIKHAFLWGINIEDELTVNDFSIGDPRNHDGLIMDHDELIRRTARTPADSAFIRSLIDERKIEGRYPAPNSNECAVGHIFAKKTGLKIGDRVPLKTMSAQFSDKLWSPVITGIFNYEYPLFDEQHIVVDFERLQRLLVLGDGTQQLFIYAEDPKMSAGIAAKAENILGGDNVAAHWKEDYWVAVLETCTPIFYAMYSIFLIVASFLIINTVVMIINERIKEIGMMGCLGMTRFEIVTVFFFESLFLAGIGAFMGVLAGGAAAWIFSIYPMDFGAMYGDTFSDMPMNNKLFFTFSPRLLLEAWLLGVGIASAFTLLPALKSAFVEPVEALRR